MPRSAVPLFSAPSLALGLLCLSGSALFLEAQETVATAPVPPAPVGQPTAAPEERDAEEEPSPFAILYAAAVERCAASEFDEARRLVAEWAETEDGKASPARFHEVQGTLETYARNFPVAESHFRQWTDLEPGSEFAHFNLAESRFLQQRYESALSEFEKAEQAALANENPAARDLARFKRIVCHLALSQVDKARRLAGRIESGEESPLSRFAEAAIRYRAGEIHNANGILQVCGDSFPPETYGLFVDSFVEAGWVERSESDGILRFREIP